MTNKWHGPGETGNRSSMAEALRARAEEKVWSGEHFDLGEPPPGEVRGMYNMLHELRVHQAELEMQNEELRQTQVDLEAARAKYFDLYNLAPAGYLTIGVQGAVLEANLTAARLLGTERKSMVNGPFTRFVLAEDQDIYYLFNKKLYETGVPQTCELRLKRPDGSPLWARLEATVGADAASGEPVCHAVMSDITRGKTAEEALAVSNELKLDKALDLGRLGHWEYDPATNRAEWSSTMYEIFARDPRRGPPSSKKEEEEYFTAEQLSKLRGHMARVLSEGTTVSCDFDAIVPRRGVVSLAVTIMSFERRGSGVKKLFGVVQDITNRKAAEKKLEDAKNEAESATMLKDKFVSLVAHDLKSPIGHNIVALKGLHARMKEEGSAFADYPALALLVNSNENMLHTIRDLLDLSRIRSGAIRPRPAFVDARHLVQYAIDMEAGAAAQKQITVINEVPLRTRLHCDMKLTGEVFANLISNAIKFSGKGATVTIGKKAGEPSTLFFRDTGIGMSPERVASLLKYEESRSTAGTEGELGTGFGLPLCNELMKGQGGILSIGSEPGVGTTVTIGFQHVAPKALVVEDSSFDREVIRMLLKDLGIEVIGAAGGEEGLELMEKELPHLIILDIKMPVIDGLEVLRRKRENPKTAAIPVIAITANVDDEIAEEAFRLGAVDFMQKPLQPESLVVRVRRIVS